MQIIPLYFFFGMFITIFILYVNAEPPKIIIKEPTIDEPISALYIDDNNVCYKYKREQVSCSEIAQNIGHV
jgi:hypothetical protein